MKNKLILFLLLFGLVSSGVHAAQEVSQKFLSLNLKEIIVTGNLDAQEISQIQTLQWSTQLGQKPSLQNIQDDMAQIYALGFIKRIEMEALDTPKGGKLILKITVHPPIQKINFENLQSLSPEVFLKKMKLKPEKRLNYQWLQDDLKMINQTLLDEGFELSFVSSAVFEEETGVLTIRFLEKRVRKIFFLGNEKTPDLYLMRAIFFKPQDIYNLYQLRKDRFNLLRQGYLNQVSNPEVISIKEQPEQVDVLFRVTERKPNALNFGFGLRSDDEKFIFSRWELLNLLGGGEKIFIKFQLNLNGQQLNRPTDLTYSLRYSNTLIEDKKMVWGISRFKQFRQENISQAGVSGTLRRNNVIRDGLSVDLFTPLNSALSHVVEIRTMDVAEVGGGIAYRKFALINQLKLDGVKNDPYQNPVAGWNISMQTENNLGGISDPNILNFDRYDLNANSYLSFTENDVLALSFKAGFISIPPNLYLAEGEIYRMGGSSTVRGYHPDHPFAEGPRRLLLNTEVRHVFNPVITGVIFYDYGSAFSQGIDLSLFRASPGVGVRLNTPIGPIKVDWGFAPQDSWQSYIHFSIGATF